MILTASLLAGCPRSPPVRTPVLNDTSIHFPSFFEQPVLEAGAEGRPVELSGAVLRAVELAAEDFLGPQDADTPCTNRRESHRYRVIQRQGILFIRIDEDPQACGLAVPGLHSGAQYAVGSDGTLLRRLRDGEPDASWMPPDAGPGTPIPSSEVGRSFDLPDGSVLPPFILESSQDAGT
ncbi:hypothetical protein OV207_01580 [Corallococcus sp. BB11-1]|uniref:hypothetical protein n=1 Tax=Corallococcus sp. BB11-1 TaxID=2996783 RepID=UPI00226F5675|nr:hypothetical protein [Corallococcus sp. BB11-1]MCY1030131.1 hypothetical protein [Corallococcus sp. BB11-1]